MKVCFVGIGSIARRHMHNLIEICGEYHIPITIDALRHTHTNEADKPDCIRTVYSAYEDMPVDYDVIFITNPTYLHAEALIKLHDHAKHFYIEKPVATMETYEKLSTIRFRNNSVYHVACPLRYASVIQYLKENIDPQSVNSIRSISSSYLPDWRPDSDYRTVYSAHRDMGGGVDIDLIHEWDYLTYLFGFPDVVKMLSGKASSLEIDSNDFAVYLAYYNKNMITELHLDYFGRHALRRIELFTEEDTVVADIQNGRVDYLESGKNIDLGEERNECYVREMREFVDSICRDDNHCVYNAIPNAVRVLKLTQGIVN